MKRSQKIHTFFKRYARISLLLFFVSGLSLAFADNNSTSSIVFAIKGVSGEVKTNIETTLKSELTSLGKDQSQRTARYFYHAAPALIKKAMKPFGYFSPHIDSNIYYSNDKKWHVDFDIKKNKPVIIHQIIIDITGGGEQDPVFQNYINTYPLKVGDRLNTSSYSSAKTNLLNLATQRGYFDAKLKKSVININLDNNQASIYIHFSTGPRYQFGKTTIKTQFFDKAFIHRFLNYAPGDFYDSRTISTLQNDLEKSNYFNKISITPELTQRHTKKTQARVPVTLLVTPSPAVQYHLGAGYGTDTGVRGLAGLTLRHLTDTGQYFQSYLRASQRQSFAVANYFIPGHNPVNDVYQFGVGVGNQNLPQGSSKNFKVSASYTTKIGLIDQTVSLTYLSEKYDIPSLFQGKINTTLLMPSIKWQIKSTDRDLNPDNGYLLSLKLSGADKRLASQTSFLQAITTLKILKTIADDNRIILKASAGFTLIDDLEQLPLSLQLFAGGTNSVRGFQYKGLGPGFYLTTASAEYQRRIFGDWYLAGFIDAGNVSNSFPVDLKYAAGPGIVWLSPIGPFELTFAKPLGEPHTGWVIQFNMGPAL